MRDRACFLAGSTCAVSISFYCSDKGLGDALGIDAAPKKYDRAKGSDARRVRRAEGRMDGESATWRAGCGETMNSGSSW